MKKNLPYHGLEQGPIRPPSEADSLCLRITRNCPWNHCTFCSLYKHEDFSLRSVEDVIQDIDTVHRYISQLQGMTSDDGHLPAADLYDLRATASDQMGFMAALNWYAGGMESVFLQDANGLVMKPANLTRILEHLKLRFPQIRRITSYARSKTIAKMQPRELKTLREAGLDRIHIGMESGSDRVLAIVKKGATQAMHIIAGIKVKIIKKIILFS